MDRKKFSIKDYTSIITATAISFFFVALTVYSATTITSNINTGGTLTVDGISTLTGNVNASGTLQVSGAARFYDPVTFESGIGASSTLTVTGSTTVSGAFNAGGASTIRGAVKLDDTLAVTGNVNASGTLQVSGAARFYDPVTFESGIGASSTLAVTGSTTIEGVTNLTTLQVGATDAGTNITGMVAGTCVISEGKIVSASSTAVAECTATGVLANDKIFVMASSSAPYHKDLRILGASSTANTIGVIFMNSSTNTNLTIPSDTLNFWAIR